MCKLIWCPEEGGVLMRKIVTFSLLLFFFLAALPGEKIAELEGLARPEKIVVDEDALYVLEGAYVFIYSLKDCRLIKKFGKKGNGPGELNPLLRYKLHMEVFNEEIILNSRFKIVFYTSRGEFKKEKRIPFTVLQVIPIDENFAIIKQVFNEKGTNSVGLEFYDSGFKKFKTAYSRTYPHFRKSGRIDMLPHLIFIRKYDNKIFSFDQKGDFVINVYDSSGKHFKKIKAEYKKRKVTKEYINKTWEWARKDIRLRSLSEERRRMAYFPDYFPVMKNFVVNDNKIYVHTYQMKTGEDKSEFVIIDFKGKILKKIYLKGADINTIEFAPYSFKKGKYFCLFENPETEKIELHIEKIF